MEAAEAAVEEGAREAQVELLQREDAALFEPVELARRQFHHQRLDVDGRRRRRPVAPLRRSLQRRQTTSSVDGSSFRRNKYSPQRPFLSAFLTRL